MASRTGGFAQSDFLASVATSCIEFRAQHRLTRASPRPEIDAIWRIALAIAREIEGDVKVGEEWMCDQAVAEFGGLTANDLIQLGHGVQVIGFLMDVFLGFRG